MLVPSASASIAGSNIFSNVSSMSCLRRSASSNWDGGLRGGDGSGRGSGVSACNHWGVVVGACWVIPRYYTGLCFLWGWWGVCVVSCYGGSESQIQKKLFSGPSSLSSAEPRPCLPPTPTPLGNSRQARTQRVERSRCAKLRRVETSRHPDTYCQCDISRPIHCDNYCHFVLECVYLGIHLSMLLGWHT